MRKRSFTTLLAVSCFFAATGDGFAKDLLFVKASRNYDQQGALGRAYRREFEMRMFKHQTWRQRLYYDSFDPDVNETIEIYSKSDGSRRLSHCRANPSLSRIIFSRIANGKQFELTKQLNEVSISCREIALPAELGRELELLWETMLPGAETEPIPRDLYIHAPIFIGFARQNDSVRTGRVSSAAYKTDIYRTFVDIVTDLREVCDRGGKSTDPIFKRLPGKIRRLTARLRAR